MTSRGRWKGAYQNLPGTVGELVALLQMVPANTPLSHDDCGLRLERVGNFVVVDFAGEANKDNEVHRSFAALAVDPKPLV